jgi:hypothetical protein
MKIKNKNVVVFDNEGETYDRFTIINTLGDMWGASNDPFAPNGFGQHCGNCAHNFFVTTYGQGWQIGCTPNLIRKRLKHGTKMSIEAFRGEGNLGKEITDISQLPEQVLNYIKQVI